MKYYKRGFLNKDKGMAAFEAEINFEAGRDYAWVGADFTVSDCSRQICLEFSIDNKEDVTIRLTKLQNLINELTDFRSQLQDAAMKMLDELATKETKND